MARIEKKYMVEEVKNCFENASGVIVTNFDKLKVVDIDELRRKLEKKSSRLIVSKNTLLKRALAETKLEDVTRFLEGTTGVAVYENDPVAVAKTLYDFSKDHETFRVRGGMVDGELVSEEGTKRLSELPCKDVLRAMVVNRLQSPIAGLVNVLSGTMRGLVGALDQIRKQKEDKSG